MLRSQQIKENGYSHKIDIPTEDQTLYRLVTVLGAMVGVLVLVFAIVVFVSNETGPETAMASVYLENDDHKYVAYLETDPRTMEEVFPKEVEIETDDGYSETEEVDLDWDEGYELLCEYEGLCYEDDYGYFEMGETYGDAESLHFNGVETDGVYRYTWYSEKVLPGGGLDIPGRTVDENGYVVDEDGYICVASSDLEKGTVLNTLYGDAKVYDTGCASGTIDVYTNWD